MQSARRSGFSLIEALVVLAIGGMALAVIFSIGVKAGDTGFALGRRAMSVADADVAQMDFRSLVSSLSLRPPNTIDPDSDRPVIGSAKKLEADVVTERATACAPNGWQGRLTLSIDVAEGRQVLNCQAGERIVALMTLPAGQDATLAYSTDLMNWVSQYESPPQMMTIDHFKHQKLWVRLKAGPRLDVIEVGYSGAPMLWIRSSADF